MTIWLAVRLLKRYIFLGISRHLMCERLVADPKAKVGNNKQMGMDQIMTAPLTVAHDRL
jgi:hypothetical protein